MYSISSLTHILNINSKFSMGVTCVTPATPKPV